MPSTFAASRSFRLAAETLLVALVAAAVWLIYTGWVTKESWAIPSAYEVDALEITAEIKLTADQGFDYLWHQHPARLDAPFGADWAAYPLPDKPFFLVLGWAARRIGLIEATHLGLLLAQMFAAAAFFYASRRLGHQRAWAVMGALLFSFSFFNVFRGLPHFSFTLSYVVPLSVLSSWLVGAARRAHGLVGFATVVGLLVGFGSPYYLFLHAQLIVFGLLLQLSGPRRQANMIAGLSSLAAGAAAFLLTCHTALQGSADGGSFALSRNYAGGEIYGLKFIELFLPASSHAWRAFGALGADYSQMTSLRGELSSPYLGMVGAVAFAALSLGALARWMRGRGAWRPAHAPQCAWTLFFFGVGGGSAILAFWGLDLFRAGNRYSIFVLAIALLYAARELSRVSKNWIPALSWIGAIGLVGFGLWDQLPPQPWPTPKDGAALRANDDRRFGELLERSLPAGSAVFEVPAVFFPEHPAVKAMRDYELFRPFLFTSTLRFSYGAMAGTPAFRWQRWVAQLPLAKMIPELEAAGFTAVYFSRRAFDDRAAAIEQALQAMGYSVLKTSRPQSDHLAFKLHPAPTPRPPDLADPRIGEPWNDEAVNAPDQIQIFAGAGWYAYESTRSHGWRWATDKATFSLLNPTPRPQDVRLRFTISSFSPGDAALRLGDKIIWSGRVTPKPADVESEPLKLSPGSTGFEWRFDGKPGHPGRSDTRVLGIKLQDLGAATIDPELAPAP